MESHKSTEGVKGRAHLVTTGTVLTPPHLPQLVPVAWVTARSSSTLYRRIIVKLVEVKVVYHNLSLAVNRSSTLDWGKSINLPPSTFLGEGASPRVMVRGWRWLIKAPWRQGYKLGPPLLISCPSLKDIQQLQQTAVPQAKHHNRECNRTKFNNFFITTCSNL